MPRGGPAAVITSKCVLHFADETVAGLLDCEVGEAYLASTHPGVTTDEVVANTGWRLRLAHHVSQTTAPSEAELRVIRDYDKEGFWTR